MNSLLIAGYGVGLCVQLALVVFLLRVSGVLGKEFWQARKLMSPISCLLIAFLIQFFATEVLLPFAEFPLLGMERNDTVARVEAALTGQAVLCLFLGAFALGYVPIYLMNRGGSEHEFDLRPVIPPVFKVCWLYLFLGLIAAYMLASSWDGSGSRSQLVATESGKVQYALTFFASAGMITLLPPLYARRKYMAVLGVILLMAALLLPLGGRGRLVLPIIQCMVIYAVTKRVQFRPKVLLGAALSLMALMASLDPVISILLGRATTGEAFEAFLGNLNPAYFFLNRNFDSFHNLSLLTYFDAIPPDLSRLLGGANPDFMAKYFPEVAALGFGYPPSVPGEIFLIGSWPGILIGGLFLGTFFGWMQAAFTRLRNVSSLIVYAAFLPWICSWGYAYFDFLLKIGSAMLPVILLWSLDRMRTRPVPPPALAKPSLS